MKALVPTRIDRGLPLSTNVPVGRRYTYILGGGASAPLDPEAHAGCTSSRTARSSTGQAGLGPMPRSVFRSCCAGVHGVQVDGRWRPVAGAGGFVGCLDPVAVVAGSFDGPWA